jgi:DNA-binding response OmpR family regulator
VSVGSIAHPVILLVEDEDELRAIVAELLTSEGYEVVTARDGAEGLVALDRAKPSIVLLDLMMPILDGYGFLRRKQQGDAAMREEERVPVIVVTAALDPTGVRRFDDVRGILPKPFDLAELVTGISTVLAGGTLQSSKAPERTGRRRRTDVPDVAFEDANAAASAFGKKSSG